MVDLFGYLGMALTLIAVYLISVPNRLGMWLSIFANFFWVVFAIYTKQWHMLGQAGILMCINIRGTYNWIKKDVG